MFKWIITNGTEQFTESVHTNCLKSVGDDAVLKERLVSPSIIGTLSATETAANA